MVVPVGVLLALGLGILMLSYEVVGVEFADFMEDQPSAGAQDAPRVVPPAEAIPFSRPAYLDDPAAAVNPVPADAVSLQRGAVLFSLNCGVCHGTGGQGDGPVTAFWQGGKRLPPNLTQDYIDGLPDAILYGIIHDGLGGMPPLRENLTERERWDVVNYVRSLKP
jgi:mono/diheme cytochrome c family protein